MKRKITPELLANCLADISTGRKTIEDCVAAHPAVGEELRSLLDVALAIPALPEIVPDPAFRARGRAMLIAAINGEKDSVTNPPLRRFWRVRIGDWQQPMQPIARRMGMPALIIAFIIAVTAATGGTAAFASQDALPGEALYPVKTAIEQIQVALTAGDEAKAQAHIAVAEKRIAEVEKAIQKQNSVASEAAAEAFVKEVVEADRRLAGAAESGKDISGVMSRLAANLSRHEKTLAAIETRAPAEAKDALARAAAAAEKGLKSASARGQKEPTSSPTVSGTPTPAAGIVATVGLTVTATVSPTATITNSSASAISGTVLLTLTQAISDVQQLANDSNVSGQSYNGLLAKLRSAEQAIGRGQPEVAERVLDAFMNELNAFQNAGHISAENYNTLRATYLKLVDSLEGSSKSRSTGKPEAASTPAAGRPEVIPTPKGKK